MFEDDYPAYAVSNKTVSEETQKLIDEYVLGDDDIDVDGKRYIAGLVRIRRGKEYGRRA